MYYFNLLNNFKQFAYILIVIAGAHSIYAAPGDLDSTFGTGGKVVTTFGGTGETGRDVVIQPDGKIIITADAVIEPRRYFAVARYNLDGTLDQSFGSNGKVTTLIPFGTNNTARALALQSDGKILVAGTAEGSIDGNAFRNFAVVRYNVDGSLDTTFDSDGIVVTSVTAAGDEGYDLAVQADGKIVMTGHNYTNALLVRYNSNGSLDTSFDSDGKVVIAMETGSISGQAVGLQSDGKIIVSGYIYNGNADFATVRFNQNGSLDLTFGNNGFVITPIGSSEDFANCLAIKQDGKIVVGGTSSIDSTFVFSIVQYNTNGTLDESFGSGGKVTTSGTWVANDLAIQQDGKIIAAGDVSFGPNRGIAVTRYNVNGSLDTRFGTNGRVITTFPNTNGSESSSTAYGIALQNDGKIVLTGSTYNGSNLDVFLTRYLTAEKMPQFDFDGDKKTDVAIYRPSTGAWWYRKSLNNQVLAVAFGTSTDKIVPADFTGDGKTDIAVFRESSGQWLVLRSEDNTFYGFPFGATGDKAVPADFDGDGKADPTVFRPSNSGWYSILSTTGAITSRTFGVAEDVPLPNDYDGDGKADLGVFRPSGAEWWISKSTGGVFAVQFGQAGDKPVPADFTGDGRTDVAFFRPSNGTWYVIRSEDFSFYGFPFGTSGDTPVPGDYDGDGKADAAVFRDSNSGWYLQRSSAGFIGLQFGASGDKPVPSAYVP